MPCFDATYAELVYQPQALTEFLLRSHLGTFRGFVGLCTKLEGGAMRYGRIFLPLSLVTLFVAPVLAHGDETTDLKAAFAAEISALNARDLETLMGKQHEQIIALSP